MDADLQKYYEERFNMMATQGWIDLIEDIEKMMGVYKDINSVSDIESLYYKKGQLDILNWIATLKGTSEKAWEELQNA